MDENSCADSGTFRMRSSSAVSAETIFLGIQGVDGGASHLRLRGGTGVSRANAETVAGDRD